MKIKKHRIKQLIKESIVKIINENSESVRQKAYDLLLPHMRRLMERNIDSDFINDFNQSFEALSNDSELADKAELYLSEIYSQFEKEAIDVSKQMVKNRCKSLWSELTNKLANKEEINIQEYYLALDDLYFENGNDKWIQETMERQFRMQVAFFNEKIKKLTEEAAQKEKFKKSLEYDSNFPVACYAYIVTTDSYGVAIPEASSFSIVFKGSDAIETISGADLPILYKNGVEIFDIDPKNATGSASGNKISPLVAEYKGKDYYIPMI